MLENIDGSIPASYQAGGAVILAVFVCNVLFWGVLWCWGAQKRDTMRKDIVERQLNMIRKEEQSQEALYI